MDGKKENTKEKEFVTIREASFITGLSQQKLRSLSDEEKISCYKTQSGHRRFNRKSLVEMCFPVLPCNEIREGEKKNYIYTRVSSKKQMDDLSRQIKYIRDSRTEYSSYILISDVASGINFKRKGLESILDSCIQGTIGNIVIAHRDRLCRFAFDLFRIIIEKSGGSITVLDDQQNKSAEQELSEDLLSIIHIYSCRQMGKRSYKGKNNTEIIKNTNETK